MQQTPFPAVHVALHVSDTISLVEIKARSQSIMAAPTVATEHAEGYDCDFVDAVPDSLSCSVCLLTLRDPHLLDCCGVKMCAPCVSRIEAADQPCPHCRKRFVHIIDKGTARQVLSLTARCSRKRKYDDCNWEGELRHLSKHETEECAKTLVKCRYSCGERIPRGQLAEHEKDECEERPMNLKLESIVKKMERHHKQEISAVKTEIDSKLAEHEKKITQQVCLCTVE